MVTLHTHPGWLHRVRSSSLDEPSKQLRAELRLPTNQPIVMSGHQAQLWHPGIAAKLFALKAIASRTRACPVWLVVDTDEGDGTSLRYPTQSAKSVLGSRVAALSSKLAIEGPAPSRLPPCLRPPRSLSLRTETDAHPAIAASLASLAQLLSQVAAASSLTQDSSLANTLTRILQLSPALRDAFAGVHIITTSALTRTAAFASLLSTLCTDPQAPSSALALYNAASLAHPEARLRPLKKTDAANNTQFELPLWWLSANASTPRTPAFVQQSSQGWSLVQQPNAQLATRAITTTLLLRRFACDLFLHGLGGGIYDAALATWCNLALSQSPSPFAALVPHGAASLAPAIVASGTLRLPLAPDDATSRSIARDASLLHRARHNPALLGDASSQARKLALAQDIAEAPKHARRALFRDMHALIERSRDAAPSALAAAAAQQALAQSQARNQSIARDRTWSCLLHAPESLAHFAEAVHTAAQHAIDIELASPLEVAR